MNQRYPCKILPIQGKWMDNYESAMVEDDPRDH